MQYEYKVLTVSNPTLDEEQLNVLGLEGWKLLFIKEDGERVRQPNNVSVDIWDSWQYKVVYVYTFIRDKAV
jgi:hypothetical protein